MAMVSLQIDASLRSRIPGITFGYVTINGVQVCERDEKLWGAIEQLCQRLASEYRLDKLSADEHISAVRGMQRAFGFDPTRYRPSSEALLRRVLKDQEIYQINTAVDVNNWCSLEFLLPMCIYDLRAVKGQMRIRLGEAGEQYQGIGRQVFQMEGKVIVADDGGVMGNTVSDSERTKVTYSTQDIFLMIYAPATRNTQNIQECAALAAQRMTEFNGGQASEALALTV
jgi:DNA/RNA-binding domain of Phe-tRNA-synthetase-like protein